MVMEQENFEIRLDIVLKPLQERERQSEGGRFDFIETAVEIRNYYRRNI